MTARTIIFSHMPIKNDNGVRQINMEFARQGLALSHVLGFYNDADFYGIQMWIDAFMTMENGPMPSGVCFKTPQSNDMVPFVQLCQDLEHEFIASEMQREDEENGHDISDIHYRMVGNDEYQRIILEGESVHSFEYSDDDTVSTVGMSIFSDEEPGSPRSVMEWDV